MTSIDALFLDIGGVLLTNGWDHTLRAKTAKVFNYNLEEMNARHDLIFGTYEMGKLTLDEYLEGVIFYKQRPFTLEEVKKFIVDQAQAFSNMIDWIKNIKNRYRLKIAVVSNEGRELALDRIDRFQLRSFVDFFIVSSFVGLRKPDKEIYQLAIDLAQVSPVKIAYIDDRLPFVEIADRFGINGFHHKEFAATQSALSHLLEGGTHR